MFGNIRRALRGMLSLLARPATVDRGRGGLVIQPYRGYGSRKEIFLMGRVFRQQEAPVATGEGTLGRDLLDLGRRLLRRGVGGAELAARFAGTEERLVTDRDGYFRVHLQPVQPPPADRLWHRLELELLRPEAGTRGAGELFVPPVGVRFVVISDIDDTVMETGVANKLAMMWRLFLKGARSRVAFPGVAAFYRALHEDETGAPPQPHPLRLPFPVGPLRGAGGILPPPPDPGRADPLPPGMGPHPPPAVPPSGQGSQARPPAGDARPL